MVCTFLANSTQHVIAFALSLRPFPLRDRTYASEIGLGDSVLTFFFRPGAIKPLGVTVQRR